MEKLYFQIHDSFYLYFHFLKTHCCYSAGVLLILLFLFLGPQQALEPVLDHLISYIAEQQGGKRGEVSEGAEGHGRVKSAFTEMSALNSALITPCCSYMLCSHLDAG